MTETLTVNDLTFLVVRSSRRKTAEISVERDGQLVVRAPPSIPVEALRTYAHQKRAWVYEKLAARDLLVGRSPKREFVAGEGFPYLGRSYRLLLVDEQDVPLKLHEGRFRLRRRDTHRGREVLIAWYIDHAKPWLEHRVAGWAERLGAAVRAVRVRDLGYRWGSCGVSGLNFHWATITLPPAVVDYVIVHELAHVAQPDHGDPFWGAVERAMPNAMALKAWLAERGGAHIV